MREKKVLISSEGPYGNILKFKPPMCFSMDDARFLVEKLVIVLKELAVLKANTQNYKTTMENLVDYGHSLPFQVTNNLSDGVELMDFPEGGASGSESRDNRTRGKKRSPTHSDEGFDEEIKKQKIQIVVDEPTALEHDELDID